MNRNKIIIFFPDESDTDGILKKDIINGYYQTKDAITKEISHIYTTQMCFLNTSLFEKNYRIFIKEKDLPPLEIKLNGRTKSNRLIQIETNLFNLWKAGEFHGN